MANASALFRVPEGATSREVRLAGLKSWLAGLLCLLVCGGGAPFLERFDRFELGREAMMLLVLVPGLVAFYLMIVGGYRLILGRSPSPARGSSPFEVSWRRTLAGAGVAVLSVLVTLAVVIPVAWLAEKLLRR